MAYLGKTPSQAVRSRYYFTAAGGETSLSGTDDNSNTLTFTDGNYVDVYLNGVLLVAATDYNTTTANTIAGLSALTASDVVEVVVYDTFSVFSGNVTGDFTVGGNLAVTGTSAFSNNIDVTGTVTADGLTVDGLLELGSSTSAPITSDSSPHIYRTNDTGVHEFGDLVIQGRSDTSRSVYITTGATPANRVKVAGNGDISFYADDGTTQGLYWDASTQRLGLGETAPEKSLHINGGTLNVSARIESTDAISMMDFVDSNTTVAPSFGAQTNDLIFYTNNSEKVRVTSAGDVGIGTSSPSTDAKLTIDSGTDNGALFLNSTDGDVALSLADNAGHVRLLQAGGALAFRVGGDANTMFTGDSEAAKLDSSGNLLVGTTSISVGQGTSTGVSVRGPIGRLEASASGITSAIFNRTTSDGGIVNFAKDGSTVGSIGVSGLNTYFAQSSKGVGVSSGRLYPVTSSGGVADNSMDLGNFDARWIDLYLSGGVYLGGTGSANKLEDYEEGTWTPTVSRSSTAPSVNYANRTGGYIKVGRLIYASFDLTASSVSGGSGSVNITGLPYNVTNSSYFAGYSVVQWRDSNLIPSSGANTQLKGFAQRGAAYLYLQYDNSGTSGFGTNSNVSSLNSSGRITGYIIYATN
jgi:hypothetical protein